MTTAVPDILARIVEHKRAELAGVRPMRDRFEQRIAERRNFRDFAAAISAGPAIISEIKKASPSKGVMAPDFDPACIARAYERGGAAALSVLTDREFFQGSLADLESARGACGLPALRKDFTIDPIQILEAAAYGADAILLIAAILSDSEMASFRKAAGDLGLAALVEVHDEIELERAIASGAKIIGVNNRDLRTFDVRLETSLRLAGRIPVGVLRVSESGIHSRADIALLRGAGYDAFLIGESLMTAGDPEHSLRELLA
jgi:indole-3-glycerol phosphate synthase